MARRLSSVRPQRRRGLGIIRVSREGGRGERLLSPELQRQSILDYARRKDIEIADTDWVEAIDESGSRAKSAWWPRLDAAIERVEAGEVDVIVVWEFSRIARERRRWAVAVDRVKVAGGNIESATEEVDVSTPSGRLQRGFLAEMHAYRAEVTGEAWKAVHKHRIGRGLTSNGKPRFGYRIDPDNRVHVPDDETGPVLQALYRRYVAGESFYALTDWLNREGIRTTPGYSRNGPGPWSDRALKRVMDSGFAAGYIHERDELHPGAHEALISAETWDAYLVARDSRRVRRNSERSQYVASGLVVCHHPMPDGTLCKGRMNAGMFGSNGQPKFRCKNARDYRAHKGGYVMAHHIEEKILEFLRAVADELDQVPVEPVKLRSVNDVAALERRIAAAHERLMTATRRLDADIIPEDKYVQLRDEIQEEIKGLEERVRSSRVESRRPAAAVIARDLLAEWDELPVEVRRTSLRDLVARVEVTPGYPRSSVYVRPIWEGDPTD